jgi:hypothetical protein
MEMWIIGIASRKLCVRDMNALVTLTFGYLGMEYAFTLHCNGFATQATARL